jgi:hypothetical protein
VIRVEGGIPWPLPGTDIIPPLGLVNGEKARDGFPLPPVPVIPHPQSPLAEKPGPPEPPSHLKGPAKP